MSQLMKRIYENILTNSEKIAIKCDNEQITYKELGEKIQQYAYLMDKQGIAYKDHIGFPMNNSIESVIVLFAAATIGAAIVPINPSMPTLSIEKSFKNANVKHLIARKNFIDRNNLNVTGVTLCLDEETDSIPSFLNISQKLNNHPLLSGDENFIITMTSGSTGDPKPIVLTQNNKLERALAHIELYNLSSKDIILTATPLYHSLAERLVIMPLYLGATSVILSNFSPINWLNTISKNNVTFSIAVSAQLAQINNIINKDSSVLRDMNSLKTLVSSSALLEPHVRTNLIEKLKCNFYEMYGASEISTATSIEFNKDSKKKNSVGYPLKEAKIIILNKKGELCKPLEIGEIACKTTLICSGYLNKMNVFNDSFKDGYFKTGDLGYLDKDGYLYFSGRKKEMIITGGINVYPPDVENVVSTIEKVEECAVFAYPHENLGECVALAIVGDTSSKRKIQLTCAKNLADYQQPLKIFYLDKLPRNEMGKVMKYKLLEIILEEGE